MERKQGRIHGQYQSRTGGQGRKCAFLHFRTRSLPTDGRTDGWTKPLIESLVRDQKQCSFKVDLEHRTKADFSTRLNLVTEAWAILNHFYNQVSKIERIGVFLRFCVHGSRRMRPIRPMLGLLRRQRIDPLHLPQTRGRVQMVLSGE